MKKLLLIAFGLLWVINYAFSQVNPEQQWLIWNNQGKNGYSNGTNTYGTNGITGPFNLRRVSIPDNGSTTPPQFAAHNDLLVIYSNFEHYNTRYATGLGAFFNGPTNAADSTHNFIVPEGVTAQYMYQTNRYEDDDWPNNVRATPGSHFALTTDPEASYNLGTTTSGLITANHDVVFGSDITLIINLDQIVYDKQKDTISLNFGGITPHDSTNVSYHDFLDLQPIFGTSLPMSDLRQAVFPNPWAAPAGPPGTLEEIILEGGPGRYRYVNLRPNTNLNNFPPNNRGQPSYQAVFTVKKNRVQVGQQLVEDIRWSHDPNLLRVESICKANDGSYYVTYHLEFENDGEATVKRLKAEVTFPPLFDLTCFNAFGWRAADMDIDGHVKIEGNKVTLRFTGNHPALHPKKWLRGKYAGMVNFTVKVIPGVDVSSTAVSLKLDNPTVYFGNSIFPFDIFYLSFPLDLYYDLVKCDWDDNPIPDSLYEKLNALSFHGKMGNADSVFVSNLIRGCFNCKRPVTTCTTECNWKNQNCTNLFPWILLGILILGFFFWKFWRKPPMDDNDEENKKKTHQEKKGKSDSSSSQDSPLT